MVGYDFEDKAYCLELTYNYGLSDYEVGTGLHEFGIFVPDVAAATQAAKDLGCSEENGRIIGPDGYRWRLLPLPEGRTERLSYVMCRVGDLDKSVAFYKNFLGFSNYELSLPQGFVENMPSKAHALSYTTKSHPHQLEPVALVFYEDGVKPVIAPWEGRHAFALDAAEVNALHAKFKAERPELIMHDNKGVPISFEEKLGTLSIFIAKDPDGYEHCFVSRETMLPLTREAVTNYDPKLLDWDTRNTREKAINEAGKEVEALIAKHPVVVFSKDWCPFCTETKDAFKSIEATYFAHELENADKQALVKDPKAVCEYLAGKTNMGTCMPKVFIKGECIGGDNTWDIAPMLSSGELRAKCALAGAGGPAVDDSRVQAIEEAGKEVEALIAKHPVVVFSKDWCPFCTETKDAIKGIGAKFHAAEIENANKEALVKDSKAFTEYLALKTNMGTCVPKVFIKGECIGGDNTWEIGPMVSSGDLLTKCVAAGAAAPAAPAAADADGDTNMRYFFNGTKESEDAHKRRKWC